ncbi:hypothetical protein GX50_01669 [[Emmonsia] crescens]|uniref:Uncharacterized protein n=1 Tax=[Emmonsia] crescens TaxID=73230 RepID=A0A2B7ZG61_9EURO|nr:hypothetical protein GX50_01669 [Emmonsia crescens]
MAKIVLENRTLPTNDPSPNDPSRRRDFGVTGEAGWASRQIERHRELEAPASGPARDEPRQVVGNLEKGKVAHFFVTGARCGCNLQLVRSGTTPGPFEDARILSRGKFCLVEAKVQSTGLMPRAGPMVQSSQTLEQLSLLFGFILSPLTSDRATTSS